MQPFDSQSVMVAEPARNPPANARALNRLIGSEGSLRRLLMGGAAWTVLFRVAVTGLSFAASLLLARLLTTDGYGAYYFLMAALSLLTMLAGLGLPGIVTREVAAFLAHGDWSGIKGLLKYSYGLSAAASVLVASVVLVLSWLLGRDPPGGGWVLVAVSMLLLFSILNSVTAAAQRGFHHIARSQLPEIARMGLFVLVLAGFWVTGVGSLDVPHVFGLQVLATVGAFVFGTALLVKGISPHRGLWRQARPHYESRRWIMAGLPLMLLYGLSTINNNADILMLGSLIGNEAVGIYHAATRGANFLTFLLAAAIMPLGPTVARLYAADERERLQQLLTRSTIIVFLLSLPLGLFLILEGEWFLRLFGEAFMAGQPALAILSVGHLVTVAAGPVPMILIMTGHERTAMLGVGVGTVSNVVLNAVLIPPYGIAGAAVATSLSIVLWNALLVYEVRKRTALHPTILSGVWLKP